MSTRMRPALITAWVLRAILLVAFFFFAFQHILDPGFAAQFALWGYPRNWHVVTAVLEVLGAILLAIPGTTVAGVMILGVVLIGATMTILFHGGGITTLIPLSFLIATVTLGWLRWSERV